MRSPARLLAAVGAVLMPLSLFLDWYAVKEGATGDNARIKVEGWDVFESTDALMTVAAIATVLVVAMAPRSMGRMLMAIGALVAGFVAVQLIDRPAALLFVDRSDVSLQAGAWLGLLGALLVVLAGALADRPVSGQPGLRASNSA
jgi:hypothetical protein